jgi:hypothetical protein
MSFWDILKPPAPAKSKGAAKPPTAAELAAALAEAEAEAERAEAAAAEVAERRGQLLLTADDATLDQVERELQLATRTADKAAAAVEILCSRVSQARETERQAGLDAVHREGEAALAAGLAAYARYGELAAEVAILAEAMADRCDEIEQANRKLVAAGDARRVADLDTTARPEVSDVRIGRLALWHQIELPSGTAPHDWHWPPRPPQPRVRLPQTPLPAFHQPPHEPGPFRSIRPESGT